MARDVFSILKKKDVKSRYKFRNFDPQKTFVGKSSHKDVTLILMDGSEYGYEFPEPLIEAGFDSYCGYTREFAQNDKVQKFDAETDLSDVFRALDERLELIADMPMVRTPGGESVNRDQFKDMELWRKIQAYLQIVRQFRQYGAFPDFLTNAGYYVLNLFLLDRAIEEWENIRKYEFGYTELLDLHACMVLIIQQIAFLESMDEMVKIRARNAAMGKNKELDELRQQALDYWKDPKNTFSSRIAAAREISKKIVPVTERTVDGWIKEFEASKRE
jgi:hypothetical protein